MIRIFITIPIEDKTDVKIYKIKEWVTEYLKDALKTDNISIFPVFSRKELEKDSLSYLCKSLENIYLADVVVFIKDWNRSRECRLEYIIANEYDKNVIEYKE